MTRPSFNPFIVVQPRGTTPEDPCTLLSIRQKTLDPYAQLSIITPQSPETTFLLAFSKPQDRMPRAYIVRHHSKDLQITCKPSV